MPTVTVNDTLARASVLLQDNTNIRWPLAELLNWLNDGQKEVVLRKPNASTKNVALPMVFGTKQSLPADGVQLLDVVRNTTGNAIRIVKREILDAQNPGWHASTPNAQVLHFCYSELDLKNFYVYPPNNGAGSVECVYSSSPANVGLTDVIAVDDIYLSALLDYILYRAYSKDAEYSSDPTRANSHYQAFVTSLGGKLAMESGISPNTQQGINPNLPRTK